MRKDVYIIAEIGVNHNRSLEYCYKLIDSACEAGCNAVKLQFFKAEKLYPMSAGKLDWIDKNRKYRYDIYSAVKSFEIPEKWVDELIKYSLQNKIDILSSVFDCNSIDFLINKGIKKIKLSSYTITHMPLIEYCAAKRVPLFISTGGATLGEVEEAVYTVTNYHHDFSLLHCSIKYPTELKDCNLAVIRTLMNAFPQVRIGWSDHTKEVSIAPVQAVYLGAKIIEKHITLDKSMKGPDHFFALEPDELKQMVKHIREAEHDVINANTKVDPIICGSSQKKTYKHEKYLRDFSFMCIFAKRAISKGERITKNDIAILRPGKKRHGLEPKYFMLFDNYNIIAKKDINFEDPITWESIIGNKMVNS